MYVSNVCIECTYRMHVSNIECMSLRVRVSIFQVSPIQNLSDAMDDNINLGHFVKHCSRISQRDRAKCQKKVAKQTLKQTHSGVI